MTALSEYQRLECTGLWREAPDAQRREVIVSFGDATLVISDPRNARALTHWSLPAVIRLNSGRSPALFAPGEDAGEALEIEDEAMIAAIAKVHKLIEARRPHPGRVRGAFVVAMIGAVLALGLLWLPRTLVSHTAAALPASKQLEIGRMALADLTRLTGRPCKGPEGSEVLAKLGTELPGGADRLVVLPQGITTTAHLPGGLILLSKQLFDADRSPDVALGMILAETLRRDASDPMTGILRHAGVGATLRLLTTGNLPDGALAGYGEELLTARATSVADAALIQRFAKAGVATTPYAYALDPTGETVLGLIEADPFRATPAPASALTDTEWVALQGICAQ